MTHVLRSADRTTSNGRGTFSFEGRAFGVGILFFAIDNAPRQGPVLHVHPYAETWIVKAGQAEVEAGDQSYIVGRNDIVVVPPNTPHKFVNLGPDRLEMVCIHANGVIVQDDLE